MRKELIALRRAMEQAGVDVYVIPTDDFHGSEYVGDYFRCRAYVSGFTGSAGTLVVAKEWAGLWTDGRYFLQGAQQLSGSGIDLCKMGEPGVPTVLGWLKEHLKTGMTLGFDGRSMTAGTGLSMAEIAENAGAKLRFDLDLVGEIWTERPPMSQAPAWELGMEYAGESRKNKLSALRENVKTLGADTFVLTSLDDLCWLLNIRGDDVACCPVVLGDLILTGDALILYTDERKFSPALRGALEEDGVTLRPYLQLYQDIRKIPENSRVLVDPSKLNYAILKGIPATVTLIEHTNPTVGPKSVKNAVECENERLAHIKDGVALTRFMKWLHDHVGKETITEISAAEKLEQFRGEMEHYLGPSFDPIMGYGPHGAIIHYSATPETDAALEPHGFLLSDTGGHYLEGSTDVTRTFVLGPLTPDMRHHYTMVLRGNLDLAGAVFKKGCDGLNLDLLARAPFWEEGLDYNHGTGHGVGYLLNVHEGPQNIRYRLVNGNTQDAPMEPGMITSDEPGLYLEGKYGIRLENLELCVERQVTDYGTFLGFDTLTMCPFERDAIIPEELSPRQRALLNAYHRRVYELVSPYFTDEENAWLREATAEI
jgi:Xaa-Pro aminopeptidase